MGVHVVARVSDLPPGSRKIVSVEGRSIGVFNVKGEYYALRNMCPHQGAPLCEGSLHGTAATTKPGEYEWIREGEILRCPWHGWEFDVTNGRSIFNPHKMRVKVYDVTVGEPRDNGALGTGIDAESVETFSVAVEDGLVLLHL